MFGIWDFVAGGVFLYWILIVLQFDVRHAREYPVYENLVSEHYN